MMLVSLLDLGIPVYHLSRSKANRHIEGTEAWNCICIEQ